MENNKDGTAGTWTRHCRDPARRGVWKQRRKRGALQRLPATSEGSNSTLRQGRPLSPPSGHPAFPRAIPGILSFAAMAFEGSGLALSFSGIKHLQSQIPPSVSKDWASVPVSFSSQAFPFSPAQGQAQALETGRPLPTRGSRQDTARPRQPLQSQLPSPGAWDRVL